MQSQELDFLQMPVLSDRQVLLAVWEAQPAKKRRVGSDRRARRQWSSSFIQIKQPTLSTNLSLRSTLFNFFG